MAETRKTKELNLLEDTPELTKKKTSSDEEVNINHEVYNKQTSDPKNEQNKFMKKWHSSKKFRIGIIVGIVFVLGLSLGLGLGLGLKEDDGKKKFTDTALGSEFDDWINNINQTPENDIRDLENAAILWSLDKEVSLGLINPSDASSAKDKAEKKADKEIDNEKKEQKKADETWDNYLTGLGFDSEEAYYNSKIANSLLATSNVVDGLVDFDDTTSKVTKEEIDENKLEYYSSNPKNAGTYEGEYLAITSNSYLNSSPNTTEKLMKLYLQVAKPVFFQQESISYTLDFSANPGSNPNEWESMTFTDNTQIQAAYAMAWKLDNAAEKGFYDLGNSDTPIIAPTQSGVKHFNSLPTDLTSLAYYYAAVDDEKNIKEVNDEKLKKLGDNADKIIITNSNANLPEDINDGTFSETSINESDRRQIAETVFTGKPKEGTDKNTGDGLTNSSLYKNNGRILGQTIQLDSEATNSNNANINNEYLLTTDATGFTITRMENPNYLVNDETDEDTSYDLYTIGKNMLESDLEKELNGMQRSENQGIVKYGIWDDFELWVNDNAKTLALNWALTAENSEFLTKTEFSDHDINYHIDLMDELIKEDEEGNPIKDEEGNLISTKKGQSLINFFYLELIIDEENLFLDKYFAADDFMIKEKNNEIYLKLNKNTTYTALSEDFKFFTKYLIPDGKNFSLTSIDALLVEGGDK